MSYVPEGSSAKTLTQKQIGIRTIFGTEVCKYGHNVFGKNSDPGSIVMIFNNRQRSGSALASEQSMNNNIRRDPHIVI